MGAIARGNIGALTIRIGFGACNRLIMIPQREPPK